MSIASEIQTLSNNKASIKAAIEAKNPSVMPTNDLAQWPSSIQSIPGIPPNMAGFLTISVTLNPSGGSYAMSQDSTECQELLQNAYVSVSSPGYTLHPQKETVSSLENFNVKFLVPVPTGETATARVYLKLGVSQTCAYVADAVEVQGLSGRTINVNLLTHLMQDNESIVELCRVQPYTSTASDSGDSWIGRKVTTKTGTRFYLGYYGPSGQFIPTSGVKVTRYQVPTTAQSMQDCEEQILYGQEGDQDILTTLNVFKNEKIVDVDYVGDIVTITNKFVQFPLVYVKTTFENISIDTRDASNNVISTTSYPCVVRWFCDSQVDSDYHPHAAFCKWSRIPGTVDSFSETVCPYVYLSRYPSNVQNLVVGGTTYSMATSRSDGSNEVGATRGVWLDRSRNVNHAQIVVHEEGDSSKVIRSIQANSDERAMGMFDGKTVYFVADLAYLMFGINSQSGLRGVSIDSTGAKAQQANGVTDYMLSLGIKVGSQNPTSAEYNFNFLDLEGGTWSAPGIHLGDLTFVSERNTTTNSEGTSTSTTRYRMLFAQDRLDYNPLSTNADTMLSAGYRWVSFNMGSTRRIGLDNSNGLRDMKLFSSDQSTKNVNYANVDTQWYGSIPAAISTYSASATYNEGAYVIYEGKLYQCSTPVTSSESFDSSKWTL